jgi:hypothetical protein
MWLWAEAIACYSLCTGAAEARVEARADVVGARERLCTGLSLSQMSLLSLRLSAAVAARPPPPLACGLQRRHCARNASPGSLST